MIHDLIESLSLADDLDRRMAIYELSQSGADAVAPLVQALSDPRPCVRAGAATALGGISDATDEIVVGLVKALEDEIENVRKCATAALTRIGERAIPILINCLANGKSDAQARAAIALGQIGPPAGSSVPGLIPLLDHEDDFVRRQSAIALGKIGSHNVLPPLLKSLAKTLDCRSYRAAETFVIALRETGGKTDDVYVAFMDAFYRGDKNVRQAAMAGVMMIDPDASFVQNRDSITVKYLSPRIAARIFRKEQGMDGRE